jgi:glyoxylase-like metal-dependent hydrolase (beta-lactamase superfamily II)
LEDDAIRTFGDLSVVSMVLGPVQTNTYLVSDRSGSAAVVIDPAWDGKRILGAARARSWRITDVWLTHAHFDHLGGTGQLVDAMKSEIPIALHPADHPLWRFKGGAPYFGLNDFDPGPEPSISLAHGMRLALGQQVFEVRHSPGHTPGHVIFVCREAAVVFSGDLIFAEGVGRTDLPGGSWQQLSESIRQEILSLPDETTILSGHGPATTVGHERRFNPFLT